MVARRYLLATVGLVLAFGCVRPQPDVTADGPVLFAAVTWNLNAGRGDVARLLDHLASGALTGARPRELILLLQEAVEGGERGVRAIAAARGLSVVYSAVRRSGERVSGNAILSTQPLGAPRVIELPRERQPRGAIATSVALAGTPLFVVNTHLENRLALGRGLFGDRARRRQAEALLREIPAGHGMLGGDMNTMLGQEEPALRAFRARFPDTPPRPQPTFRDRLVLDHLFFDLPDGWAATRRVVADRYGSDHQPVLALVHGAALSAN